MISNTGLNLIRRFEQFNPTQQDDGNGNTIIGYGHRIRKWERFNKPLSEDQAVALLRQDAEQAERAVQDVIKVPLTPYQQDALISLICTIGSLAFYHSSLAKSLNAGDLEGAANEFSRWIYTKRQVCEKMVNRRQEETRLFRGER